MLLLRLAFVRLNLARPNRQLRYIALLHCIALSLFACDFRNSPGDNTSGMDVVDVPPNTDAYAFVARADANPLCTETSCPAPDLSQIAGTWYLVANQLRLDVAFSWDQVTGRITGLASDESGASTPVPLEGINWDPSTGQISFRRVDRDAQSWFMGRVVDGVLTGRVANLDLAAIPTSLDFQNHVTGWNADIIDHGDIAPRVYDLLLDGEQRGRLEIARDGDATSGFTGTIKVTSTILDAAHGEQEQYDINVLEWDGNTLVFATYHDGQEWLYTAVAQGRQLNGSCYPSDTQIPFEWHGTRAGVLGYGLAERSISDRDDWQERTRARLAHLMVADNPAPLSTVVTPVATGLPPISLSITPVRDDDFANHPQNYTLDELNFDYTLANSYGTRPLVRHVHGYLARPTTPPPPNGYPIVLALNGHWGSAHQVMDPNSWYYYGDAFARRGYMVLAIDLSHRPLAQRNGLYSDFLTGDDPSTGNGIHPAIAASGFDSDWTEDGERAWDAMRGIDYLLAQPHVDPAHLMVTGLSMGGEISTFVGALDTRPGVVIVAGYSPDMDVKTYVEPHYCWHWAYADISEYISVSDLHALGAPRGLVVETGVLDPTYSVISTPFSADKQVLRRSRVAYSDAPDRVIHFFHDSAHAYRIAETPTVTETQAGVSVPTEVAPVTPWSLEWQVDPLMTRRGGSLFDLISYLAP